jgi:magnesium chelatase family protein
VALAQVHGVVLSGVAGAVVRVEVDVSEGLPSVGVVGLPDTSVTESRWRARCAVVSIGRTWPNRRITISLAPAEVRKQGAGLDLPIAIGVLVASEQLPATHLPTTTFVGELGLDGRIRATQGALAGALAARRAGIDTIIAPTASAPELARITGLRVLLADHLNEVVELLMAPDLGDGRACPMRPRACADAGPDLRDVRGHVTARLALEVAAAGGHHVALVGSPGVGKTLLAQRLPGLLPDLGDDDALEVAALYSVAGITRADGQHFRPPLRAPHHSASAAAVLGSVRGARVVPGAATLAHAGVLFLDEAPEFARPALEGLRQPLESGTVSLDRTGWNGVLPARFQLVLAANPCPCGLRVGTGAACSCAPAAVRRYASRLSGPLLDRVDIRLALQRPPDAELATGAEGESSDIVRERVRLARDRATARLSGFPWRSNADVPAAELRRRWPPDDEGAALLRDAESRSANLRGPDRVLRMAWSLADLGGRDRPGRDDVAVALGLRGRSIPWAA